MNYDTVFVDWDKTLSHSRFWGHWDTDSSPSHKQDYELIQDLFFGKPPSILDAWMRGGYTAESAVGEVAHRTGLAFNTLLLGLMESCVQMQPDTQALALMDTLRERGTHVVIATDNMDTFSRWTVHALSLESRCDAILISHGLRALKKDILPDGRSAFFEAYFAQHNIDPDQTLLIDDSSRNAIVEKFGMHFTQVTPARPAAVILRELVDAT